jgi:hypothetical protein
MLFEHLKRLREDDMLLLNRGYSARLLVALLLGRAAASLLQDALVLIARRTFKHREELAKPHKYMSQKPC